MPKTPRLNRKKAGGSGQKQAAQPIRSSGKSKSSNSSTKKASPARSKKARKKTTMSEAERERYNLVQKINKRIRDTVNKIGVENETVQLFETALTLPGRATVTAYTEDGKVYHLLSRSKEDLAGYTTEDLQLLVEQTPKWETTKKELTAALNRDRKEGEQYTKENPPSLEDLREQAWLNLSVHKLFEDNADLFYMLIDSTGWEDIREHTREEIYREVHRIQDALDAGNVFNWSAPPEEIGEQYIQRREASRERRAAALRAAYFEE